MGNLIIYEKADLLGTSKLTTIENVYATHGSRDAADILDGTHAVYRAVYAGVFRAQLRKLLKELSADEKRG